MNPLLSKRVQKRPNHQPFEEVTIGLGQSVGSTSRGDILVYF